MLLEVNWIKAVILTIFLLVFTGLLIESLWKLKWKLFLKSDDNEDDVFFSFQLSGNEESGK